MFLTYLLHTASMILLVLVWMGVQIAFYSYWFFNLRTAKHRLAKAAGAGGLVVAFISAVIDPQGDIQRMYAEDPTLTTVFGCVYAAIMTLLVVVVVFNVIRHLLERIAQRAQSGSTGL